jgi:phosphoserine phosphatase
MVEIFHNSALQGLPYHMMVKAGKNLYKLSYPYAKRSVIRLCERSTDYAIITKTFKPAAISYIDWFKKNGLDIKLECNEFKIEDGKVVGLRFRHDESKKDKTLRFLAQSKPFSSCTVFGDTDDDLDILSALDDKDHYTVAVHPKDSYSDKLVQKADIIITDWAEVYNFLNLS